MSASQPNQPSTGKAMGPGDNQPSAGAMRAADAQIRYSGLSELIYDGNPKPGCVKKFAEIIDRETHVAELVAALAPFAAVMDAYEKDCLDEVRPSWKKGLEHDLNYEMLSGRGGKHLLSLHDFNTARAVLANVKGQP